MFDRKRTYRVWFDMVSKIPKGILVEPFLQNFENFLTIMGPRPEGMALRLIDETIGFVRGNLIWGPARKQKPPSCKVGNRKKEHNSWKNMMVRTYYPSHERQKEYAKIGCYVEKFLQDFENFYAYMGPRPEGMTLDRIDPWGPYVRGNIKWSTPAEQNRNTKRRRKKLDQLTMGVLLVERPDGEKAA